MPGIDRATFQRELAKYKIVRLEDHCKSREKRAEVRRIEAPRPVPVETPKEKIKAAIAAETEANKGFWELMTVAAREVLSEEETEKFLAALRQSYTDVPELINLEDLNHAASLI